MEDEDQLNYRLGDLLAKGTSTHEIVNCLINEHLVENVDGAIAVLRSFYDNWQDLKTRLDLKTDDIKNWHLHLRHKILETALEGDTPIYLRTALAILESLADIQGVQGEIEDIKQHELTIVFEAMKPPEKETTNDEDIKKD